MKTPILIRDQDGRPYFLTENFLREKYGPKYYQMAKSEVRKALRMKFSGNLFEPDGVINLFEPVRVTVIVYPGRNICIFSGFVYRGCLHIGCRIFGSSATRVIRKWAAN